MDKTQVISEIAVIEQLIAEWKPLTDDPEVTWAIYLLEISLERRRERLRDVMH